MEARQAGLRAGAAVAAGLTLVAASVAVPRVADWDVHIRWPPLHAAWDPHAGPRLLVAIAVGLLLWSVIPAVADRRSWRATVVVSTAGSWVWAMALAMTDGRDGLSRIYVRPGEYLYDAVRVDDIGHALTTFIDRMPLGSTDHWHIHVSGHPPGALLFFVLLDRIGISDPFWVAVAVVTLGATAVAAVLMTLDLLGSRELARRAAPWVALAPTAVWAGTGESVWAAVAAWGLYVLAAACTRRSSAVAVAAGLVLGLSLFLSYGLVLFGLLAVAVFVLTRAWRLLPWVAVGVAAVALAFWAAGFAWWAAYPVLRERYYAGIASDRPYAYWVWADLAAWTFTAGLVTWAAFPRMWSFARRREPLAVLALAALACVVVASLSGMSKGEVERIWLPFTLWIVTAAALLPPSWRRPLLFSQVALGVAFQSLLVTAW